MTAPIAHNVSVGHSHGLPMFALNPCIAHDGERLFYGVRFSPYSSCSRYWKNPRRVLSANFTENSLDVFVDPLGRPVAQLRRAEDMRCLVDASVLRTTYSRFTGFSGRDKATEMRMATWSWPGLRMLDDVPLRYPGRRTVEKNWVPLFRRGEALLVAYSIEPHVILGCTDDGACADLHNTSTGVRWHAGLRGGTPCIPFEAEYLCLAHLVRRRVYRHVFYTFDHAPPHRITRASKSFRFPRVFMDRKDSIQFANGIARVDGKVQVSYGVGDCVAMRTEFRSSTIRSMLSPVGAALHPTASGAPEEEGVRASPLHPPRSANSASQARMAPSSTVERKIAT